MGVWEPCRQWDSGAKPLVGLRALLLEADDTFCDNMLFCHG